MNKNDFLSVREDIISRIPISELAKEYGLCPKGYAEWKSCKCPWHDDKSPSLGFNDRLGYFKCFAASCGRSGSIFDLVSIFEGLSFWDAFCKLSTKAGISLPSDKTKHWKEKQGEMVFNQNLTSWLKDNLISSKPAFDYLIEKRGYSKNIILLLSETIQLGYLPEGEIYGFLQSITGKNQANHLSKTFRPLADRIIAPWYNFYGEVAGWWARTLDHKEPKYLFSKGTSKDSLYLLNLAKRYIKEPVLYIVEGFFDAGISHVLGFPQIAATGGAAVPNKAQLLSAKKVGYKVIVLLPDPDQEGETAIAKSSRRLIKEAKELSLELLIGAIPNDMDLDQALVKAKEPLLLMKDIAEEATDIKGWLEQYYQKREEKASTLLESAIIRSECKENISSLGKPVKFMGFENTEEIVVPTEGWTIPEGWHIQEDGLYQSKVTKDGEEQLQKVAHTPFIPSAISVNIDTGSEQLELAFPRFDIMRKVWMDRGELLNQRSIVSLANQGFPVTSRNAGVLVDYIADFEAANLNKLPKLLTVSSFGWKHYEGKKFFILGENAIGTNMNILFVPGDEGERNYAKALRSRGEYSEWLKIIRSVIVYPRVAFGIYASFTPPLLPILERPSFQIDYCGESSIGKSTVLMVAASPWGDPVGERGGIVPTWNATSVSIERYASLFKALPIFLDDSHLASDHQVKSMIYMLSGGVGKMRGSLKGTQSTQGWYTVGFITGERPVITVTKHEGARARVIEFYGSPFKGASGETVSEIKTGVSNHFGHAGPIYLDKLIPIIEKKDTLYKKTEQRNKLLQKISQGGIDNRRASYFASVWTTASLVEESFSLGGDPDTLIPSLFEETCENESDFAQKALEAVSSWVMANWNNFSTEKEEHDKGEVYGVIKTGEYVGIFPHKLSEYLEKVGYSYEAVMRSFRDRGWIQTNNKNIAFPIRYKGTMTRVIKISWKMINII